ncbi:hypothetical protein LS48_09020 [Aequorivita aquimaris]|uniref:Uncharacterized protein n=1 Tax=Aequorivita aquimaris TaxID=1548749 RepID=A0A137RGS3_9FLAO|nr:hypothetical protein LS48_09020 [Aequorivita aquimaris]
MVFFGCCSLKGRQKINDVADFDFFFLKFFSKTVSNQAVKLTEPQQNNLREPFKFLYLIRKYTL